VYKATLDPIKDALQLGKRLRTLLAVLELNRCIPSINLVFCEGHKSKVTAITIWCSFLEV
jgi:hypothetical protein